MITIKTKNINYTGLQAGVHFSNGVGFIEKLEPHVESFFKKNKYIIIKEKEAKNEK